jgi:putative endonuclease
MDLKATKGMRAPHTRKSSPKSGRALSIGAVSQGSRNTWRAWYCEERALHFYLERHYTLLKRHWKSPFAEVDLVLRSPTQEILLVEVKSVTSFDYLHVRLTSFQKQRLRRCLQFCLEKHPRTRLELAVVSRHGEVMIFEDIFG